MKSHFYFQMIITLHYFLIVFIPSFIVYIIMSIRHKRAINQINKDIQRRYAIETAKREKKILTIKL